MSTKKCKYCGTINDGNAPLCTGCGANEFSSVCSNCGTAFDAAYCPNCGTKRGDEGKICPRCGKKYFTHACPDCGYVEGGTGTTTVTYTTQYYQKPAKTPLSQQTWFVILMLFIFFPAGLIWMWTNMKWPKAVKIVITAIFVVLIFVESMAEGA